MRCDWHKIKLSALFGGLLIALFLLYLPPEVGSALAIPPDSSEYAISLVNLFEHGIFGFTLNGIWYPSRYSPWFSLSCLTPAYILGGGNAFCFHWAILGFALALLTLIYKWGQRLGLGLWAVLPPILIMFVPDFVFYSRIVMTEVPYVALFTGSSLLFVKISDCNHKISWKICLVCGLVVSWGGMIRPTMLPMLLPFAIVLILRQRRSWLQCLISLIWLITPAIIYGMLNSTYNWIVFSSPFRSGYHYWMPIPNDYPDLLFNVSYIEDNVRALISFPLFRITFVVMVITIVCTVLAIVSRWWKPQIQEGEREFRVHLLLVVYFLFQGMVLASLYLPYYWPDSRFFLILPLCILPLFLSSVRFLLADFYLRLFTYCTFAILCATTNVTSTPKYHAQPCSRQRWYIEGQISLQKLPRGSMIIQGGDANVFDHFGFREKELTLLPYGREFDYTRQMIAPTSIQDLEPRPLNCWQCNIPELMERGICKTPFPDTFCERPSLVWDWIRQGRQAFICWDVVENEEGWEKLQEQLRKLGLTVRLMGAWGAPAIHPNPIRKHFDRVVLAQCPMDRRPEFSCILYEIIEMGKVSPIQAANLNG